MLPGPSKPGLVWTPPSSPHLMTPQAKTGVGAGGLRPRPDTRQPSRDTAGASGDHRLGT